LAVARVFHGVKLGAALLWDAIARASRSEVAVYAIVVDTKGKRERFYLPHGFLPFPSSPKTLILPLKIR
jgi:predicted N-acetyltransferase YhbS